MSHPLPSVSRHPGRAVATFRADLDLRPAYPQQQEELGVESGPRAVAPAESMTGVAWLAEARRVLVPVTSQAQRPRQGRLPVRPRHRAGCWREARRIGGHRQTSPTPTLNRVSKMRLAWVVSNPSQDRADRWRARRWLGDCQSNLPRPMPCRPMKLRPARVEPTPLPPYPVRPGWLAKAPRDRRRAQRRPRSQVRSADAR